MWSVALTWSDEKGKSLLWRLSVVCLVLRKAVKGKVDYRDGPAGEGESASKTDKRKIIV